jgi:hypothetical protein
MADYYTKLEQEGAFIKTRAIMSETNVETKVSSVCRWKGAFSFFLSFFFAQAACPSLEKRRWLYDGNNDHQAHAGRRLGGDDDEN